MSSRRARRVAVRCVVAGVVLLLSAAAGLYTAAAIAPGELRAELERRLEQATGERCRVAHLRVVPGLPVELEGRGLVLWNGTLRVEQAVARVSLLSVLFGELRLARLELDGVRMRLDLGAEGSLFPWSKDGEEEPEAASAIDAAPLPAAAAIEEGLRALLERRLLADALRVTRARVPVYAKPGDRSPLFVFEIVQGQILHSQLRGSAELRARTRVLADGRSRGFFEWEGRREGDEPLRLTVAATECDLGWLGRWITVESVETRGVLSGVADYQVVAPGQASVALDVVARDLAWIYEARGKAIVTAPRVAGALRLAVDGHHLELAGGRIESGDLALQLDAVLALPITLESNLGLTARLASLDVARARELIESLPAPLGERAKAVASQLEGGRIVSCEVRGGAPLRRWRETLTGHTRALPRGLEVEARIEKLALVLGADDRIEDIAADIAWTGDHLQVRGATGRRSGIALPTLDFDLVGVSHLFAADLSHRIETSGQVRLPGLSLLLSAFEGVEAEQAQASEVELWIDRLEHPALLWPMESLEVHVRSEGDGLFLDVPSFRWAKVPFRGEIDWFGHSEHLVARFEAAAQPEAEQPPEAMHEAAPHVPGTAEAKASTGGSPEKVWASGHFDIGPLHGKVWRQKRLRGRFEAVQARVSFSDLEAELAPRGTLTGQGYLDLGRADALPHGVEWTAKGVDAAALLEQAGLGEALVSGRVEMRARLEDTYVPGEPVFSRLSGHVDIDAYDGVIQKTLPVVLALTLASERIDFTPEHESIRYSHASASLALKNGVVSTDAFQLDGPDLRMFGSGTLDLARPPHRLDAEVAIFLFRPVDWAIGAIPVLNTLLLGESKNLVAVYFEIEGPWNAPVAEAKPLRTLSRGSMEVVKGIPRVVQRGLDILGAVIKAPAPAARRKKNSGDEKKSDDGSGAVSESTKP